MSYIYLAAPWVDKDEMPERASQFESKGHIITHKWWIQEGDGYKDHTPEELCEFAKLDYMGVMTSETVVVFNTKKSEGKAVEQGIAITAGIPIIAIGTLGELPNIFHYWPEMKWVKSIEEALEILERKGKLYAC